MDLQNIRDLKLALKLAGLKPNKDLGQHFLVDAETVAAIMQTADIQKGDTVLEIGPGLGVMTDALAATGNQIVAVDADERMVALLRRRMSHNVRVEQADILQFDLRKLPPDYKVVANVPYYITSPILRLLMESDNPPATAVLLIQKEVAQRLVAGPGNLSVLSLSVQYYAEVELVVDVPADKFWPAPKVDSAVVKLTRRAEPVFAADPAKLFRLIKAGFGEKRKQLRNSLAGGLRLDTAQVTTLLEAAVIAPTARAQELSLTQWHALYEAALQKGYLS